MRALRKRRAGVAGRHELVQSEPFRLSTIPQRASRHTKIAEENSDARQGVGRLPSKRKIYPGTH
jgi:hypothetical protein